MKIYLVRHGETDWNKNGLYQGQKDIPLNELGRKEAKVLASAFKGKRVSIIYSSDLTRAKETAEIIAKELDLQNITYKESLREMDFGNWTGKSIFEMEEDSKLFKMWQKDPWTVSPPNGETLKELANRVRAAIEEMFQSNKSQDILVVTHAGPIKALIFDLIGSTGNTYWNLDISHNTIVVIEREKRYKITLYRWPSDIF
ncbi:MAG: alpha-ribazole phosphatase [bacterium]